MEKRILKWITGCVGILTVVACATMVYLPALSEALAVVPEELLSPDVNITQQENIQVQERPPVSEDTTGSSGTDDADKDKEKLHIELPEGLDGSGVKITNHYLTQTVSVRFSKGVDNYAENYAIYGSSNHISAVSYYRDGAAGVLEIALDQVCELSYTYKDNFLCVSFIDPHDIYDKVIVVDAGHGGRAPGAVKMDVYEKNLNLAVVKEIKALFDDLERKNEVKVYYTRLDDTNPSLAKRVGLANKAHADLFISIHHNSSSSGKINEKNGTMVLYNQEDNSEFSSKRFAEMCIQNVMASAGSNRRGLAKGNYVQIVRESKVPVALIEVGYMTNVTEMEKLKTPEYQKLVAQGVYNAVMQAFAEGY